MFYPADDKANCLLNTETRKTKMESFSPEEEGVTMIYVDAPEGGAKQRKLRDAATNELEWTNWTKCQNGITYRFKNCAKQDVRKCQRQAKNCAGKLGQKQ